jgi:putative transposase
MKTNISHLQTDTYYHIYNRGINGQNIFNEDRNYPYFLSRYAHYIQPVAQTFAYCLLKNHFHFLIKTRSSDIVLETYKPKEVMGNVRTYAKEQGKDPNWMEAEATKRISQQFSSFFSSYALSFNKLYKRTGGLFEEPFRRIPIRTEPYFVEMVYYIHMNPQKHRFVSDFRTYPHSSYHSILSIKPTQLERTELLSWFADTEGYQRYHLSKPLLEHLDAFDIEFD